MSGVVLLQTTELLLKEVRQVIQYGLTVQGNKLLPAYLNIDSLMHVLSAGTCWWIISLYSSCQQKLHVSSSYHEQQQMECQL